jgi:hypothetical protein
MLCCTFAGHRDLFLPDAERKIITALDSILESDDEFIFYTGGMGEFDSKCASAVRTVRHRFQEKRLRLVLVLPYMTNRVNTDKNYFETEYDDVMIPIGLADIYPKAAIRKRNRWMVDRSDILLACVYRDFGGAYDTMQYALRKGVRVFNLT